MLSDEELLSLKQKTKSKHHHLLDEQADFSLVSKAPKRKAYVLLYDNRDGTLLFGIKRSNHAYAPGAPCLFGGTREDQEHKSVETLQRELTEESGGRLALTKDCKPTLFYTPDGGMTNFFWTSDFAIVGNLSNFNPNAELEDVISVDAIFLRQQATTKNNLARMLFFLCNTQNARGRQDFLRSKTLGAIYDWITRVFPDL